MYVPGCTGWQEWCRGERRVTWSLIRYVNAHDQFHLHGVPSPLQGAKNCLIDTSLLESLSESLNAIRVRLGIGNASSTRFSISNSKYIISWRYIKFLFSLFTDLSSQV